MEPQFQKTFIPKKPVTPQKYSGSTVAGRPQKTNIFSLISLIIFFGTLIVAGGVFGYGKFLSFQIGEMKADLEIAVVELQDEFFVRVVTLDNRLKSAKEILSSHVAPSIVVRSIDRSTLPSIQFTNFTFAKNQSGAPSIDIKGRALSFAAVALQADLFAENKNLVNSIFYDLGVNEKGEIEFGFRAEIRPDSLNYANNLSNL